jgi:type II secretion system protein H
MTASLGFTLIELLVVLVILGLLSVIVLDFIPARTSTTLKAAAYTLAIELRSARAASILRDRETAVLFDLADRTYTGFQDASGTPLPPEFLLSIRGADEAGGDQRYVIRFFSDGSSTGGVVELTAHRKAYRVAVRPLSGAISVDE